MAQIYLNNSKMMICGDLEEIERITKKLKELFELEVIYSGRCG
ncbi:MAG: hypothetical protein NZ879_04625 [Archaeoglobaceae archaeon]|nr:hypothetical protein [Archaeoglobaceae archaeon]MDW8118248.1 hypothetical protein [Archaeoglobaceae archaeon]